MKSSEQILQAALDLANRYPYDKITYADIARAAGVHWTTVQRYFGSKEEMRRILKQQQTENNPRLADTRTKILEAAGRVFARYGYNRATLDQVAKEAGMTKGAVYWHFSSKSDLYLALCDRSLRQLLHELPTQSQDIFTSSAPQDALSTLLASQFEMCEQGDGERPMLFLEFVSSSREPAVKKKLCASFSKLFEQTADILAELKRKQLINSQVDPHALSVTFHALINGIVLMWLIAPNQISFKSLSADVSKILWYGIQPEQQ
ncbi:AcrR family transcriptional regulator [Caldalkalibacillus uzonensis]|uniref:AcrR family transcriptional regulator n=1 Tax=Caldalkalibacillus uzonensis TaxID=353224 RepID=A0ABU0CPJ8_9BACI|nr:TetR/AcrR family transcriptional regulator [Caldalkalibacillus uzonensis]MDQ0337425.1 AcrR family transcriptional regulator [Caldalkalibacillus uzonensis]